MRFENQSAIVVGASEGIGRATVLRLVAEGARVVAVARDADKLTRLAQGAGDRAGAILPFRGDAAIPATAPLAVDAAIKAFGRVDVLVNCVGGSTVFANPAQGLDETSDDDWARMFGFNLDPMLHFSRAVIPLMKEQRSGKIVNLSSIAGRGRTGSTSTAYSAAKGAVIAFTKQLARELAPWGINVNATAPGLTMSERLVVASAKWTDAQRAATLGRIPLGRGSTPDEQAGAICFLASKDASFVTGVTLDVTGGA